MTRPNQAPMTWSADLYRTVPEQDTVKLLALMAWAFEPDPVEAERKARQTLERWVEAGLKFCRGTDGERLFDTIEVTAFPRECPGDTVFYPAFAQAKRRHVLHLAQLASAAEKTGAERKFVVDFKRVFNLRAIEKGRDLRLRLPLPLTSDYLRDLEVKPLVLSQEEAKIKVTPGRLEARVTTSGEDEITLGATISFQCRMQTPQPRPDAVLPGRDRELYLAKSEGMIQVTERVSDLAAQLAGRLTEPLEVVKAFWIHLKENLSSSWVHYDQIDMVSSCDWILDSGLYDCQMGSSVLVALCRARGIPARVVGGFLLYQRLPCNHFWVEAWIDGQGWTPFDLFGLGHAKDGSEPEWRDRFFGKLDYRMTCERFPREFTGAIGVPIPPIWQVVQMVKEDFVQISLLDAKGPAVYSDFLRVTT